MYESFLKIDFQDHMSRLSDESVKSRATSNNSLNPLLAFVCAMTIVKSNWSCFRQDKITYSHGKIVNIVYEISKNFYITSYSTLKNCFFGAVINIILELINILGLVLDLIEKDLLQ